MLLSKDTEAAKLEKPIDGIYNVLVWGSLDRDSAVNYTMSLVTLERLATLRRTLQTGRPLYVAQIGMNQIEFYPKADADYFCEVNGYTIVRQ